MRVAYCHDIYRGNRIKIFYILEFASFCKKKKEKKKKIRNENVYLFYLYIRDTHERVLRGKHIYKILYLK